MFRHLLSQPLVLSKRHTLHSFLVKPRKVMKVVTAARIRSSIHQRHDAIVLPNIHVPQLLTVRGRSTSYSFELRACFERVADHASYLAGHLLLFVYQDPS